jgi:DNA-binding CsgD family transcriptional regulator/ligand-binding sensor domain-containing protein
MCKLVLSFFLILIMSSIRGSGAGHTVINFTNDQYRASSQNWSVSNFPGGSVFVGNEAGLLEFDGSRWILHQHPEKLVIRSVLAVSNDLIYTGSFDEFGVWERDQFGRIEYRSLVTPDIQTFLHNDDIWNILKLEDRIYFQSFSVIFVYSEGKVSVVDNPQSILFLSDVRGRLLVYSLNKGIFEITGNKMHFVEGSDVLARRRVHVILPLGEKSILFGTERDGLFIYDGKKYTYWDCEASDYLKAYQLNRGIITKSGLIILGTIQNGLIVIDSAGRKINEINMNSGLQNNTILGLSYQELTGNLWIALNRGIDMVNLESVYTIYLQKPNIFGTVFTALYHKNILYLGTNQGLYYKQIREPVEKNIFRDEFRLIPGTQGQVWELKLFDGQIFCGHNLGTFIIEDNRIREHISEVTGGWNIKPIHIGGKDYLIQSTYTKLIIYSKDSRENWKQLNAVEGFSEPIQFISIDRNNSIWASHSRKGIYRIELSSDLERARCVQYYGKTKGLPSEYNVNVFDLLDEILFTTTSGLYRYDRLNDTIVPHDLLNNILTGIQDIRRITPVSDSLFWLTTESNFILAGLVDRKFKIRQIHPNQRFQFHLSERNKNVVILNDSVSMLIIPSGFVLYNYLQSQNKLENRSPLIILRDVNSRDLSLKVNQENPDFPEIPYRLNEIRFSLSTPGQVNNQTMFQYKLEGIDTDWNAPVSSPEKSYSFLPPGNYNFMARLIDDSGRFSRVVSYRFRVLNPWYFSLMAFLGYLLLAALVILLIRHLTKRKYLKKQQKLQEQHEREKLQAEVDFKVKQLAGTTLGIISKNEVLLKLKSEFLKHETAIEKSTGRGFIKAFLSTIEQNLTNEEDWKIFEDNFDHAHSDFLKRIRTKFHDITPGDLKMCAYLRMNLSSKEIASMLNLSVRSVEIKRYRLRKKLGIPHDANLIQFMMEF